MLKLTKKKEDIIYKIAIMDKRNIVHVVSGYPTKSETFIINQLIESIEKGYSAKIIADTIHPLSNASQPDLLKAYHLYKTAATYNVSVPKNKLIRIIKAFALLVRYLSYTRVFLRTLNTEKFGAESKSLKLWYQAAFFMKYRSIPLFHAHFGVNGVLLAKMKEIKAIKGKIIVSFYGYDTFSTPKNRSVIKSQYKLLFKYVDVLLVNSNYLRNNLSLLEAPTEKIRINHVGVDQKLFAYKERVRGSKFRMITIGRLMKLKGQHLGLEVIKLLKQRGHEIHYTIVGDGEEMSHLKELATLLNIEEQITFYGSATQKQIVKLLYDNDLFLMTSITDETGRAEGQGLVTAEAQSTGIPAIGFHSGGIPETIDHENSGYIVEEKDVNAMTNAVEKLINDSNLLIEMGKNAHELITKKFNNKVQCANVVGFYSKIENC